MSGAGLSLRVGCAAAAAVLLSSHARPPSVRLAGSAGAGSQGSREEAPSPNPT